MKILNLVQGSDEWLSVRKTTRNASEAPAMKGVSPYKSYADLVKEKATGITEEVNAEKQRLFDRGHEAEDSARPLVEELIGDSLYPMTASDDEGYLLASSDGATLPPKGGIGFEHKLWNEKIAAQVAAGTVPESHAWQLDQQIAVFGFEKIIFVVSNGTPEKFVSCEYRTTPERIAALMAGWKQFDEDCRNYEPEVLEAKPILVAKSIENLPALHIELTGRVSASNLVEFKAHATSVISSINTDLQTDQDFVDAKKAVKYLENVEDNAKRAKSNALAQTTSIDELFKALDEVIEMAADVRKNLDKKIKEETASRKTEMVMAAKNELSEYVQKLNKRLGGFMQDVTTDFALVIKGMSSVDNMRSEIAAALANSKVTADGIAAGIETNVKSLDGDENWRFLFPDLRYVCAKASDDFSALLAARVAAHKAAEEKRMEAERENIRAEEQAKAQREAAAKAEAERKEQERIATEAKAKADREAAEKAAIEKPVETIALGTGLMPITQTVDPIQRQEPVRKAGEVVTVPPQDYGRQISGLVSQMTSNEQKLVLHFCERTLTQRQEAANV